MANYPECLLCDSKVSEVCGKLYVARGKKPPCARAVVENCHSPQRLLKAEIRAIADGLEIAYRGADPMAVDNAVNELRELSAI